MQTTKIPATKNAVDFWLLLFPITYLIHIAEEYWGGEGYSAYLYRLRGVHLSPARFLIAQSLGFILITLGVILARRFSFPQTMLLILGTIVLVNGLTHGFTSLSNMSYGPGLLSAIFIWLPLGAYMLIRFRKSVGTRRFIMAVAIGIGINVVIAVITMRGGRL